MASQMRLTFYLSESGIKGDVLFSSFFSFFFSEVYSTSSFFSSHFHHLLHGAYEQVKERERKRESVKKNVYFFRLLQWRLNAKPQNVKNHFENFAPIYLFSLFIFSFCCSRSLFACMM